MPTITSVLETVLYADDLDGAVRFYVDVLGLTLASDMRPLSIALRVSRGAVVLIFNPNRSSEPGRPVPSHGAEGSGHVAFQIDDDAYDSWLDALAAAGIPIEHEHVWNADARSIYVRDPAGNSVELITADIW
jgi:catechol 2,3-dioxygenase-like lactoylglutathione lyase family enzyme